MKAGPLTQLAPGLRDGGEEERMGPALLVVGAMGFIVAVVSSAAAYQGAILRRPVVGVPPRPGLGDVPRWVWRIDLLSGALAAIGATIWIASV